MAPAVLVPSICQRFVSTSPKYIYQQLSQVDRAGLRMSEASTFSVFTTRSEIFAPNLNTRLNLLLKNNKKNHNHKASLFLSDHRTCPRYTSQQGPWHASWTPLSFSRAFAYASQKFLVRASLSYLWQLHIP